LNGLPRGGVDDAVFQDTVASSRALYDLRNHDAQLSGSRRHVVRNRGRRWSLKDQTGNVALKDSDSEWNLDLNTWEVNQVRDQNHLVASDISLARSRHAKCSRDRIQTQEAAWTELASRNILDLVGLSPAQIMA